MNAKYSGDEMRTARQLLGMPGCYTDSNIHIYSKEIAPSGLFLFTPPEQYQLYFLLKGTMNILYRGETITIQEGKLFFLTGKESIHFTSHSECLLLMVCFKELTDRMNIDFFEKLSDMEYYKVHKSIPLFAIPEKLKVFAMDTAASFSNKEIHPSTLELIFTFLRASFTPMNMAILFHEMIENMTRPSDVNKSTDPIVQTIDFNT